jgi:tripartite ATP-independent transporter DctM subunit
MAPELLLTIGMFGGLVLLIMFGVSLGFAMGAVAVVAGYILYGPMGFFSIISPVFNYMWMVLLAAVPLFILIGVGLASSNIATDMYSAFYLWSGRLRGGLAVGSCGFAAALSAMTGNCAASTMTAGLVGIPPMKKKSYDEKLAFGTIGAAGTLGILIPPSLSLIIIGMMVSESVGKLFAGGLSAGLIILFSFILYILIRSWINPNLAPAASEDASITEKVKALKSVALPGLIIITVLGTIFFGVATPTESAAVGALAVALAVAIRGELTKKFIQDATQQTAVITGMVVGILFGAGAFVAVYASGGGLLFVQNLLSGLDVNPWVMLIGMQALVLVLGMFLDPMGIILICLPLFFPVIQKMGYDPVWFAIIFNINLCIGYITPPFGYNLFYLKSLSPKTSMSTIYASVVPFILIMLGCEVLMMIFPDLITFLPRIMING